MTTVTLSIASREAVTSRFLHAVAGHAEGHFISFETPSLLFGTLTAKRWDLLAAMQGAGPLAASDLACRVGREVKGVQADLRALLNAGIVEKTPDGEFVFPYDALHVDFSLRAA
jgi:predicted transcriptional regulator